MTPIWSEWRSFPNPAKCEYLIAPLGVGCYELKLGEEKILFGVSSHVASRVSSLLPKPLGTGTRNNEKKRKFVLDHIAEIEYRTIAFKQRDEAKRFEDELKRTGTYRFHT